MTFGINKCATMVVRPNTRKEQGRRDPTFYLGNKEIPKTNCYTYLGIRFDNTLSLKPVINSMNITKGFLKNPLIPIPFKRSVIFFQLCLVIVAYYAPLPGSNKSRTNGTQQLVNKSLYWISGSKNKEFFCFFIHFIKRAEYFTSIRNIFGVKKVDRCIENLRNLNLKKNKGILLEFEIFLKKTIKADNYIENKFVETRGYYINSTWNFFNTLKASIEKIIVNKVLNIGFLQYSSFNEIRNDVINNLDIVHSFFNSDSRQVNSENSGNISGNNSSEIGLNNSSHEISNNSDSVNENLSVNNLNVNN
ncbi:hypothetical protein PIROE2DRAFT_9186 [Piromyces sp. E2]|nr:hypothetical protein PIROE2DRAFT_9186 [Piromyces sp. E2]|eukprot:OUM64146.1 hypothetical protein PIROE2DRAFT_9186 [Piromyces sp. E2]